MECIAMLFNELGWVYAELFIELLAEILDIVKTSLKSGLVNITIGVDHHLGGFAQPYKAHKAIYRLPGYLFNELKQV